MEEVILDKFLTNDFDKKHLTYIYRNEQARIDWLKQLGELNLIPLSIDKEEKTKIIEKLKILGRSESEITQILGK